MLSRAINRRNYASDKHASKLSKTRKSIEQDNQIPAVVPSATVGECVSSASRGERDGPLVNATGLNVGDALTTGALLGPFVGFIEGSAVCPGANGLFDGCGVGIPEGEADGFSLGIFVGFALGSLLGEMDGFLVGAAVGFSVGDVFGFSLGAAVVGVAVVGLLVGPGGLHSTVAVPSLSVVLPQPEITNGGPEAVIRLKSGVPASFSAPR